MTTATPEGVTWAAGHDPAEQSSAPAAGQQADYFAFAKTNRFVFPDGITWIEFSSLNEGQKKQYQDGTSSDMVLERGSGNARMTVKQGTQRHELIKSAVTNWNLMRNGQPVPFSKVMLGDFLALADPKLVEDLEREIRKANPWLLAEMSVEEIDREMRNLEEMREAAVKREAGEGS